MTQPAPSELDQKTLAEMHRKRARPLCPCQHKGVEMYIAKVGDKYIVKRMPGSGSLHSPECDSYEPPPELSGLGEVLGSAIKENTEEGVVELRFDFSLSRIAGRAAPQAGSGEDTESVRTDGAKLTLRSTLHYLWDQAGFNRWLPAMEGKRNWSVVRRHLIRAAESKIAKGAPLSDQLYIPETFILERKKEIQQNRHDQLKWIRGGNKMMIVIGEVKGVEEARFGHRLVLKHCADFQFILNDDIFKRMDTRYKTEIDLWRSFDDIHLVAVATFSLNLANHPVIEELSLMTVTSNWIPFENIHDKAIIDLLVENRRRFFKGLRYNLPASKPLAAAVLSDTLPSPTALYAIPLTPSEGYLMELEDLIAESRLSSWQWDTNEYIPPPLPPVGAPEQAPGATLFL